MGWIFYLLPARVRKAIANNSCATIRHGSCGGDSWTTSGQQNTVPPEWNDRMSSVRC
ncbi:hypothetical protein LX36DRAFT_654422 [Colletotrichum falcatum]|nr:hypothetical protein LX36DRAFT_654422 [Colletotrichum falcatum]